VLPDFCMGCILFYIMCRLAYAAASSLLLVTMLPGLKIAHIYLPMLQTHLDFTA